MWGTGMCLIGFKLPITHAHPSIHLTGFLKLVLGVEISLVSGVTST